MWTQSHPLYGAQLRFERADTHLAEADTLLHKWADSCHDHIVSDHKGKVWFPHGWPAIPTTFPLVISDAVHNMRAALDYIVYELALLDSGKVQDGTQFIIEDLKSDPADPRKGFDPRSKQYLKGLSVGHIAALELLQPYNGVEWTKALRDLSNPDKHRKLTALTQKGRRIAVAVKHNDTGRFWNDSFHITPEGPVLDRFDLEFDGHDTIAIAPPDPNKPAVMQTLRSIQLGVGETIEAFKPEFKI